MGFKERMKEVGRKAKGDRRCHERGGEQLPWRGADGAGWSAHGCRAPPASARLVQPHQRRSPLVSSGTEAFVCWTLSDLLG